MKQRSFNSNRPVARALVCALLIGSLFTIGCRPGGTRPLDELSATAAAGQYTAQAGDTLEVNVWGEPRLSGEVLVREDGQLTMQLINDVTAEGKTLKALSDEIADRLKKFVPGASVTVSVVQSAPIRYFLSGQFQKPGEYRSDKKISLLQAIATGGGFAPFADESNITLIRKGGEGDIRYSLDYNRVVDGRDPNPELKNGDFVTVK